MLLIRNYLFANSSVIIGDSDSDGTGEIRFDIGGTTQVTLTNNGDFNIGSSLGNGAAENSMALGSTTEPSTFYMGEDSDNNSLMGWDNINNYFSIGTRSAATDYPDTLIIKDGNIGIGTATLVARLNVAGMIKIAGTGAEPCTATEEGSQRYNSTSKKMEFCNGTVWGEIGGGGKSFGGIYSLSYGSCYGNGYNPVTGSCSCPAGYSGSAFTGYYECHWPSSNQRCISYMCWK